MKTKIVQILTLVVLVAVFLSSCSSSIKFAGFDKTRTETRSNPLKEDLKKNLDFQNEMLGKLVIPDEIYSRINRDQPVIFADYSRFPFVKSDSLSKGESGLNTYVLNMINFQLSKDALKRNIKLLENNSNYNEFDNNFDEYDQMLVSEVSDFGIKIVKIEKDTYVRTGVLTIHYKVLDKKGVIIAVASQTIAHTDTLYTDDVNQVNDPSPSKGYANALNPEFNSLDNAAGERKAPIIDVTQAPEVKVAEKITGVIFTVPSNTKTYNVYSLPYGALQAIGKNPASVVIADIMALSPTTLSFRSSRQKFGIGEITYEAVLEIPELKTLFGSNDKIEIYNESLLVCCLQLLPDNLIIQIK